MTQSGSLGHRPMRGRRPPRESRHRQVEAPPEEMHGAALPMNAGAKEFEQAIDLHQHLPESLDARRASYSCVLRSSSNGIAVWISPEWSRLAPECRPSQAATDMYLRVEVRHRVRRPAASWCSEPSFVLTHTAWSTKSNRRRTCVRHAVSSNVVSPRGVTYSAPALSVILHRRESEPRLADDLSPHVQRRQRILPLGERQRRPGPIHRLGHRGLGAGSMTSLST